MLLNTLPEHMLHTPRLLEILNMSRNLFTTVPLGIGDTHNLQELILDDNPFTAIK